MRRSSGRHSVAGGRVRIGRDKTTGACWDAGVTSSTSTAWPPLPYREWEPTKQTLHRYCQIVGKVRMALVPFRNHWWHVTLYVTARGLSTGPMPNPAGGECEIAFD